MLMFLIMHMTQSSGWAVQSTPHSSPALAMSVPHSIHLSGTDVSLMVQVWVCADIVLCAYVCMLRVCNVNGPYSYESFYKTGTMHQYRIALLCPNFSLPAALKWTTAPRWKREATSQLMK